MKKSVFISTIMILVCFSVSAQDLTSKKGETFLPEEGDWALGIDASPILYYLGNAFNGNNSNGSPGFNFVDGGTMIYGKWFKTADMAWRGRLRFLGVNNDKDVMYVSDDLATTPNTFVEDARSHSQMEIGLAFGIEKRRGNTRLQGFYGAEVMVTYGSSSDKYTYGNEMTTTNIAPTTSDFGNNLLPGGRIKERNFGSYYFFGVRPFIGVEYFILPKISLGGEFGIDIGVSGNAVNKVTIEYFDPSGPSVAESTYEEDQTNKTTLKIDNTNLNGAMKLMFHF